MGVSGQLHAPAALPPLFPFQLIRTILHGLCLECRLLDNISVLDFAAESLSFISVWEFP
jgi:hypothetical protein